MQVDQVQDPMIIEGASPNIAVVHTGSADEVAPATENVIPVLENIDGLAWQILYSLGPTITSIKTVHQSWKISTMVMLR